MYLYIYKRMVALSIILLVIGVLPISAQQGETKGVDCPSAVLTTTFAAPPSGMANFRTVRLDEQCNLIEGPVLTVSVEQLPPIAMDRQARSMQFETIAAGDVNARQATMTRTYHTEQSVRDIVGITLNQLYSNITFAYNGYMITSFNAGGGTSSHGENMPPSCGPGWNLTNGFNAHIGGGVGMYSADFLQYGEFGYRGLFDCSGNSYYNRLSNHTSIYANGTGTCQFTQNYRTWSSLWYWTMACY